MTYSVRRSIAAATWICLFVSEPLLAGADPLAEARAYFSEQRWQLAASEFQEFLADHPKSDRIAEAMYYRGMALVHTDRFAPAQQQFATLIRRFPDGQWTSAAKFRFGEAAYLEGHWKKAEAVLAAFEQSNPEHPLSAFALTYLGEIALKKRKPAKAERLFARALEKSPDHPLWDDCILGLGRAFQQQNQFTQAERQYEKLTDDSLGPHAAEATFRLGLLYYRSKNYPMALEQWDHFGDADDPLQPRVGLGRGWAHYRMGQHEQAAEQFARLVHDPEVGIEAHYWWARAQQAQGQWELAATTLRDALDRTVDHRLLPAMHFHAGVCLVKAGRASAGIQHFDTVIRRWPDSPWQEKCLAQLDLQQLDLEPRQEADPNRHVLPPLSDHSTSRSDLDLALLKPRQPTGSQAASNGRERRARTVSSGSQNHQAAATIRLARKFEQQQRFDPALAYYRRAISKYPNSEYLPTALFLAARLHDRLQQDEDALPLYEQVVRNHAEFEMVDAALYGWAWALQETDQPKRSIETLERLHAEFPSSQFWGEATYLLAEDAYESGQTERAVELVDEVLQADSLTESQTELLSRALYLQGRLAVSTEAWESVGPPMRRLIQSCPNSALRTPAEYWVAEALFRQRAWDEALERFDALSIRTADQDDAWLAMIPLRRAQILARQKRWSEAVEAARRAIARFPEFERRHEFDYIMGRCFASRGEYRAAREALAKVVESSRSSNEETAAMAQWLIGETYMHQKDYAQAQREYLRTNARFPFPEWQARALLQAGKCSEAEQRWGEAQQRYAELLDRFPQSSSATEAKRRQETVNIQQETGT